MEINYFAVVLATIAQFAVGFVWYMPIFGKVWGEMHGFDKLDKKTQKEMQSQMGPYYAGQLLITVLTTIVLAKLLLLLPNYSPYALAFMSWVGFVVPTQVSAVLFGGTDKQWMVKKTAIMAFGSLACLLVAALILSKV